MRTPPVFDVCGPLPTGTTVLEASAGTGKTFTIAALATRYVAEGVATLPELLLVTFGRAATSELRDRVRARFVATERALRAPDARQADDAVVRHLAAVDDTELDRRRERLIRALADFDAATIATTHGFCQHVLTGLGVAGDVDADAVLVPDLADLVDEVVDDLYLQRFADAAEDESLPVGLARTLAHAVVGDPEAAVVPPLPGDAGAGPAAVPLAREVERRVGFARAVSDEVRRRKRHRRLLDYDDLLVLLRDALADPVHGAHARERVRSRYAVVLVDEFQDTDPVQWEVLRLAFVGHRTLVLIGDPKQAIYAFRGADVVTYLSAADSAGGTSTLGRSWRSDEPLLRGLEHLLAGAALGDDRIVVRPVEAQHRGRRLEAAGAPVRLRQVTRAAVGARPNGTPGVGVVRDLVVADVVADLVRLLENGRLRDDGGGRPVWRAVLPGDVAVLTRRNADASAVRDALAAAGVPAVESGLSSVFGTEAARHWLVLLQALEQPGNTGRAAAAALTPFVGWDAARLAGASGDERDDLADLVRRWAGMLAEHGVAALAEATTAGGLAARVLGHRSGERLLTDLRHVGQALHQAAVGGALGPAALVEWLRHRAEEAGEDYAEERSRRLDSDAAAVQVVTVHASKGLEFPVVYVPFAWDRWEGKAAEVLAVHDDAGGRVLHVGGPADPGHAEAAQRRLDEERGEDLRLLYVALTRAACQVVVWWAPSRNTPTAPLTRVLLGGRTPGEVPVGRVSVPRDDAAAQALAAVAQGSAGTVTVEQVGMRPGAARWEAPPSPPAPLAAARLDRRLDLVWRRTSYTALVAAAHADGPGVASEPETIGTDDERDTPLPAAAAAGAGPGGAGPGGAGPGGAAVPGAPLPAGDTSRVPELRSPMADLPGGAAFGTLVHAVLEDVRTDADDLDAELLRACRDVQAPRVAGVDATALATALGPVLATPLGPLAAGVTLRDVPPRDRLAEAAFELPLAGGDRPAGPSASLTDIAALLREHLPDDDPFAGYPDRLAARGLAPERLRGYLTGSLDAVLRLPAETGPRYLVVDYKTNRLAPPGEALTSVHYRPSALREAMLAAHYPLQLLLYEVALHRLLRWRQTGYDPQRHLGGALYLFVRGMCGPGTPVVDGAPCGVLGWRPPTALVTALSRLLDAGERS